MPQPPAPHPTGPRKMRIVGVSGSGKSSLAKQVADRLDLPRLELDAVFWGPNWTFRDLEEARSRVREFAAAHPAGWVVDGNWSSRLDGLLNPGTPDGADALVWLDHLRSVVMRRMIRRTLRRGIRRDELWHGNREQPWNWLRLDPEKNIVRWAWTQHPIVRERMLAHIAAGDPVIRLTGQGAVDAWLADLSRV